MYADFDPVLVDHPAPVPITLRLACEEDAAAVAHLLYERQGGDTAILKRNVVQQIAATNALFIVAETAGEIAGFARIAYFTPPTDAPSNGVPAGWYLQGIIVSACWRRRGIGEALTRRRLAWIAERASEAYYFANANNRASLALHERLGFQEVTRDFWHPGVNFEGGVGILCRVWLQGTSGGE